MHGIESEKKKSKSAATVVGETLLSLAAVGGVLCILAVIAAFSFNITLIMFKTGSMSPTIPTGSLAVVREIPASEVRVDEIVTIDRAGKLPVTHRVTSIHRGAGGERIITMKGDANPAPDPAPYTVSHVRLVIYSLPGLAYFVVWLSNPLVRAGIAVGVAALATWAFWPRDDDTGPRNPNRRLIRRKHSKPVTAATLIALIPAMLIVGALAPEPAHAANTETVVNGTYLTLTSLGDPAQMLSMEPGRPVVWEVGIQAHPPQPSTIFVGISAQGPLAEVGGLQIAVNACTTRWVGHTCPGAQTRWLATQNLSQAIVPVEAYGAHELAEMPSNQQRWLQLEATMEPGWPPGATAVIQIHAWGAGDAIHTGGSTVAALPETGSSIGGSLWLAILAIAVGIAVAQLGRRHQRIARRTR